MKFKLFSICTVLFFILLASCNSQPTISQEYMLSSSPSLSNTSTTYTPNNITFEPAQVTTLLTQTSFVDIMSTTLEARGAKCRDYFYLEVPMEIEIRSSDTWTLFTCSPTDPPIDDNWTLGAIDYGTRYTQIVKFDFSKTWTIQHNSFDYSRINRENALMLPYHWSADGTYLYLYPMSYPGGSGYPQSDFLYAHISDLYRINLETGKFEIFLKSNQFTDLSFSPNDHFFIYSEYDKPNQIHVRNMKTDEDIQININENFAATGAFVWSPDSTKVVFFVGHGKESENWQDDLSDTSIFVLTPQNMHIQKILEKDTRKFAPERCPNDEYWLDDNTICLYSVDPELSHWDNKFTFNIKTGEFEAIPYP